MPNAVVEDYLQSLRDEASAPNTGEHTYRPFFKDLGEKVALHLGRPLTNLTLEPGRVANAGAPDAVFYGSSVSNLIGYAETKDLGASLDNLSGHNLNQFGRYLKAFPNWIYTNYLEFRLYQDGQEELRVTLCQKSDIEGTANLSQIAANKAADLDALFDRFLSTSTPMVADSRTLARLLAHKARILEDVLASLLSNSADPNSPLKNQLGSYRTWLIPDLTEEGFADLYAQTVTYGLFLAAYENGQRLQPLFFDRQNILTLLPTNVGPVRALFQLLAGDFLPDELDWIIDDIVRLLDKAEMGQIAKQFAAGSADPTIHFYETFLENYDPELREKLGSYYTPDAVVDYIVSSVDTLLRQRFDKTDGLANPEVTLLDPALGTGTFLVHALKKVSDAFGISHAGAVAGHVKSHTLKNFYGFELQAAAYVLAHLKLEQVLKQLGVNNGRANIYLTNTLADHDYPGTLPGVFEQAISEDGRAAARVKGREKVLVVLGNPPYGGTSHNVYDSVDDYRVPGERARNWLQNDYVKFIRWAEWKISESKEAGYRHGIVAFITDHSYLRAPLFRGMRKHLLDSFDSIHVLNLHGNSRVQETLPSGVPSDKSVFDIQQGTSIVLLTKDLESSTTTPDQTDGELRGDALAEAYYSDLWGDRQSKYDFLSSHDVSNTSWTQLPTEAPSYFFVPRSISSLSSEYNSWVPLPKLMPLHSQAIVTARDKFVYALDENRLVQRMQDFKQNFDGMSAEQVHARFGIRNTREFDVQRAGRTVRSDAGNEPIYPAAYRPFDKRYLYYSNGLIEWPREEVTRPLLSKDAPDNFGIVAFRHSRRETLSRAFISSTAVDARLLSSESNCYVFPLYRGNKGSSKQTTIDELQTADGTESNLAPEFLTTLCNRYGQDLTAEEVFDYVYGVLNSPGYRLEFQTLLQDDFPRIPFPSKLDSFIEMAQHGKRLRHLHLLSASDLMGISNLEIGFPVSGSSALERGYPTFGAPQGRVYINASQYFDNVSEDMWEYEVGSYKPMRKWLEDRRGETLDASSVLQYQTLATAIKKSQELTPDIEATWQTILAGSLENVL